MRRKLIALITAMVLLMSVIPAVSAKGVLNMKDMYRDQWFYSAANYCISNSLMVGTSNVSFSPKNDVTRAMFVQTLYRMSEEKFSGKSVSFTDVKKKDWFKEAVDWAASHKIVRGVSKKEFHPQDAITREQIAVMIKNYAKYRKYIKNDETIDSTVLDQYADRDSISSWAKKALAWAVNMHLIGGYTDGTILPKETTNRAEVAVVIAKFCDVLQNPGSVDWAMVRSVNHMGYNLTTPENTEWAFDAAKYNGFNYVETDVRLTKDRVPVLLHDATINRTARYTDGSKLQGNVYLSSLTYDEVRKYDFGIFFNEKYKGTKIPSLEEFIAQCRKLGLHPYLELKPDVGYGEEDIKKIVSIVQKYKWQYNTTWIGYSDRLLKMVREFLPEARLGVVCNYVAPSVIPAARELQNGKNTVFIDSLKFDPDSIELCRKNDFPMEIWVVDDENIILNLDRYVSGVTSNRYSASALLNKHRMAN